MPKHYSTNDPYWKRKPMQTAVIVGLSLIIIASIWSISTKEEVKEVVDDSPFSEDCKFLRKVQGGDLVISEPSAGKYSYEVYATSDGIEIWACDNFFVTE